MQQLFKPLTKINLGLAIVPFLIYFLGLITVSSITPKRLNTHIIHFVIGVTLYIFLVFFDYSILKYYWKYLYGFTFSLLLLTFFLGQTRGGSSRWFGISSYTFQPSEIAKIAVIIVVSALVTRHKDSLKDFKNLAVISGLTFLLAGLVVVQPDLSTTLMILAAFVAILFYAGLDIHYFLLAFIFFGIFSTPAWNLLQPYQKERVLVFFNPHLDVLGSGYNVIQSMIAVGSGQVFGKGYGHGTQSHLQFLPAYWTDFIYASFAEEWGFIGAASLIFLYVLMLSLVLYVALRAKNPFGSLICIGTFIVFFAQFTVNVGMNMGIMPVTGIPLPLVSYGGTSMVVSLVLLGLVQSVWVRE